MAYIGNTPADKFLTLAKQSFSTSATTSYTLDSAVSSTQDIALFINNVRQSPVDAYTVSGTSLTLSSATAGTDEMYCVYLGKTVGTVSPASDSVTTAMIQSNAVNNAKMADDAIGLAELSATGTASSSNFLRGDNSWASAGGGDNDPMFSAKHSGSSQTLSNSSWTKLTCLSSELFDYDSAYDGDKFTVPSGITDQPFLISGWVKLASLDDNTRIELSIRVNGTSVTNMRAWGSGSTQHSTVATVYAQQLSATDYVELFAYQNTGSNQDISDGSWSVHKLIKG